MKTFVTFGQVHRHEIGDKVFDKDCVCVIEAPTYAEGRKIAFDAFNGVFCFSYPESEWDESSMKYFPRGYINLEEKEDEET